MLPPLERIFGALGVDRQELLGMGKQMGIGDAINNHADHKSALTVSIDDVNGFVCERCNTHCRRPPLVGACECGGSFLFSSSKGPANTVLLG